MPPEESAALQRARRSAGVVIGVVAVVAGCILAALALFLGVFQPEVGQHLLGQSEKHRATVSDIDRVDFCSRRSQHTFTFEWTQDGAPQSGSVKRCGDPWEVGEHVTIWATDGDPQTQSPMASGLVVGGLLLALAALGALTVRALVRQRRIFTAALAGTWRPIACPTTGHPATAGFRILDAPEPVRADKVGRGRAIHTSPIHTDPAHGGRPEQVPGTLFLDSIRRGKPRRLVLWSGADGTRLWRWYG